MLIFTPFATIELTFRNSVPTLITPLSKPGECWEKAVSGPRNQVFPEMLGSFSRKMHKFSNILWFCKVLLALSLVATVATCESHSAHIDIEYELAK